ncbi:MAG: VOC family protein [Bacteroidia bacterium]|nr:VOC family protein [Bacteroidia bacterium]
MLTAIHPKLPMRSRDLTREFYEKKLGFSYVGSDDFNFYLIMQRDQVQIHFFEFKDLDPLKNYGQVYIRTNEIEQLYGSLMERKVSIHPNGALQIKPWGQKEFALLDPDHNLLTFGQSHP